MGDRDGGKYDSVKDGGEQPQVREVAPRFTYRDYLRQSDDKRYELIEGELVLAPTPSPLHQGLVTRILRLLHTHVSARNLGAVLAAPLDVVLSDENVLQPDVLFVATDRLDIITQTHVAGAPDLVVEILSKSSVNRDRIAKRDIYRRYGVKEYWIVDPVGKSIEVFTGSPQVHTVKNGPARISPLLSELVVDLPGLFREPYYLG